MMKKLVLLSVAVLFAVSCIRVNENPVPRVNMSFEAETEGIFIHVKKGSDNPHEVLMALSMAKKFSDDYDVLMYFDIDGIEMVTKDAPDLNMEPFGSSDDLFDYLVDHDVTIFACPGCMEVEGVSPSDLRSGVTTADKHQFFDFTDGRILSIDY
jgi:predicted peroxiredoxin